MVLSGIFFLSSSFCAVIGGYNLIDKKYDKAAAYLGAACFLLITAKL